jgi:hypothetical protein
VSRLAGIRVRTWLVVAVLACVPAAARGQSVPPPEDDVSLPGLAELRAIEIPPRLDALVERLGDASYTRREEATAELLSTSFVNTEIYAVLAQRRLTPEQRHRLLSVVRERLLNAPRGAVGIKIDNRWRLQGRIVVEELLPDLPARHVLEVGDRITHIDGRLLADWNEFVERVQSSVPGEKITLTVERVVRGRRPAGGAAVEAEEPQFEQLEIELVLGSADRLVDPVTGRPQQGGSVVTRRAREADLAMIRFGSMPKLLKIRDH